MPRATSKPIDPAITWANLLQAEVSKRGTVFPKDAKTFAQIVEMRKKAGLPHGKDYVQTFLADAYKKGAIKRISGSEMRNGRLIRTARYLIA